MSQIYTLLQPLLVGAAVLASAVYATRRWWRPWLMKSTKPQGSGCSTSSSCGSGCGSCGGGSSTIQVDDLMRELRQKRS